jgi:imidazolonepropionase-like amidohydrolase
MKRAAWMVVAWAIASSAAAQSPRETLYHGGQVWTGLNFEARDLAVRGDRIVDAADLGPNAILVDVTGRWLTPAYANAHAHITNATMETSQVFTDAGVFYVWNPNTIIQDAEDKAFFARPDTFDVRVAQGGITEPGGHPERLYVEFLSQSVYAGRSREWFIGNAFHYGTTPAEIDAALDLLKSQGADFVKAYLLNSERYAELKEDPAGYGRKGLNPENFAYLVQAAHARGLPVFVHMETAHDLEVAARAGADFAAHLPGYGGDEPETLNAKRITPELAALVASSGMRVIPTYGIIRGSAYNGNGVQTADAAGQIALQRENLRLLRDAGVPILIGTDGRGPIFSEAEHLVEIDFATPAEATRMVLGTAPALFPERRIGCLERDCEADFLVLDADPTVDIAALRRIETRVMQGTTLEASSATVD